MSKKARLAKAQRRRDRNVLFYSHTLTLDQIQEAINEMYRRIVNRPKHPLETIIVAFNPFIEKDVIFNTKRKINDKTLLFVSPSVKDIFEKMEKEVGIRAARLGEDIEFISPLGYIDPYKKEMEILQHHIYEITSVPKQLFIQYASKIIKNKGSLEAEV